MLCWLCPSKCAIECFATQRRCVHAHLPGFVTPRTTRAVTKERTGVATADKSAEALADTSHQTATPGTRNTAMCRKNTQLGRSHCRKHIMVCKTFSDPLGFMCGKSVSQWSDPCLTWRRSPEPRMPTGSLSCGDSSVQGIMKVVHVFYADLVRQVRQRTAFCSITHSRDTVGDHTSLLARCAARQCASACDR